MKFIVSRLPRRRAGAARSRETREGRWRRADRTGGLRRRRQVAQAGQAQAPARQQAAKPMAKPTGFANDRAPSRTARGRLRREAAVAAERIRQGDHPCSRLCRQIEGLMPSRSSDWASAAAHVRPIVWCGECGHQVEPDPAELARKLALRGPRPNGGTGSFCSRCGSRQVDMVVTGTERR